MTIRFVPRRVRSATDIVATERQRTSAERDAFARFAHRIAGFETSSLTPILSHEPAAARTVLQADSATDTQLARVCNIYRETVMSVPHYGEEYDESLRESLTEEFSPEITVALMSADRFTSQLQDQLITKAQRAATNRDTFLTAVDNEVSALEAGDERLTQLGRDLSDFLDTRSSELWSSEKLSTAQEKLRVCEHECQELAVDRQATLHEQRMPGIRSINLEFEAYLYEPLSVTYPLLADITSLIGTIHTLENRSPVA